MTFESKNDLGEFALCIPFYVVITYALYLLSVMCVYQFSKN